MPADAPPSTPAPAANWRLLLTPPARGAWNMAVDEAVLEAVAAGAALPTLRLYAWEPACLSLGFTQPASDVDRERLREHGWELVRRPTGGRAILHVDELTYAVIAPLEEPRVAGGVLDSYRRLAGALLRALALLDLPASAQERYDLPPGAQPRGAVCFDAPSNYEITADGKKLIGSAQARRYGGVLQHGSLPLGGDIARITQALAFPSVAERAAAAARVHAHAATAADVLGRPVTWEAAARALARAFVEAFPLSLTPGQLSPAEALRAEELVETKYDHPAWTGRT